MLVVSSGTIVLRILANAGIFVCLLGATDIRYPGSSPIFLLRTVARILLFYISFILPYIPSSTLYCTISNGYLHILGDCYLSDSPRLRCRPRVMPS